MKRLPLFIPLFLAIWATVLLAPPLNLLFRAQLHGSDWLRFSALPAQREITNFWEKAAQRFPNDRNVLIQAAQEYPQSEEAEDEDSEYSDDEYEEPVPVFSPDEFDAFEQPPDPLRPRSQIFPGTLDKDTRREKLRRLDWLLTKFPNDPPIIALRLRLTLAIIGNGRVGGEMSDPKIDGNQPEDYVSPERSKEKPTFTTADLDKAIALASRGGKTEPDNGYFDWMKCYFLMQAWRDDAAFRALDAAASKKRFDEHLRDAEKSHFIALETVLGRKLLLEEKLEISASDVRIDVSSRYREMGRILAWQAVKAQRRGDHQQCLRITASFARTAARMREYSRSYIEALVAMAMESIAWNGPVYDARQRRTGRARGMTPNQRISSLQAYATKHGRPELAAEAGRNYDSSATLRKFISSQIRGGGSLYGISFVPFLAITFGWKAGVILLLLLPLGLLLPVVLWPISRIPRLRRVLALRHSQVAEFPDQREVWSGALACGALRALATAAWGVVVIALCIGALMLGAGRSSELFEAVADVWKNVVTDGGNFLGIEGVYFLFASANEPSAQWRYVLALAPLLFGVPFAIWRAAQWQKRANGEKPFRFGEFCKATFQSRAWHSPSTSRDDFDVTRAFLQLAGWVLTVLLFASWVALAFWPDDDSSGSWLVPFAFVLLFAIALVGEHFFDWRKRPHRRAAVRYGARLFHRSLLAWLLIGSALYLALLLVLMPVRNHVEARVDRVLELGELRAAKEK